MNIVVVSLVDKSMTFEKKRWSSHSWSVLALPTSEKKAIQGSSLLSPLANMCTKYYCYPNCIVEFLSWAVLPSSPRLAKKVISVLSTFFRSQLDGFCYYLLLQFHRSSSSTWSTRIIYPQMALFRLLLLYPKEWSIEKTFILLLGQSRWGYNYNFKPNGLYENLQWLLCTAKLFLLHKRFPWDWVLKIFCF